MAVVLWMVSCNSTESTDHFFREIILKEKDLIPEGLTYDPHTGTTYIGSTHKRKIIEIDSLGNVKDFIPRVMDTIWSPLGMEVDQERNILWVNTAHANEVMPLINADTTRDWMTALVSIDLQTGRIINTFILNEPKAALNDLTVNKDGEVFMTESVNNRVYVLRPNADSLQLFLDLKDYTFPNGITHDMNNTLFVSVSEGILKIDINSKNFMLLENSKGIDAGSIDGLSFYMDYLIGHQSIRISKFLLNEARTKIIRSEIIDSGPEFDSSTTGELSSGYYIYIVNSQISSGVDYEHQTIKPLDSLENVIIRRIKL